MLRLPIGDSDFKTIVEDKLDFVDKSLFIKEVIDDARVVLITRPRRFGKTLNMSMLRYFLDINSNAADLFANLKITKEKAFLVKHQSQYPVIDLTFKDVKSSTYETAYQKILEIIQMVYLKFQRVLLNSDKLTDFHKEKINAMLKSQVQQATIENSLLFLSNCLHDHYGKKVCILIDEYDTPIHAGFLGKYYQEIVELFRGLLGAALKDNPYLFKAVLTGILRVSKESLFSGLNNIAVYSILSLKYGDYFGFTENEVAALLAQTGLQAKSEEIRCWYNGYQIGDHRLYNPWSIVSCLMKNGVADRYWLNTSDNALIKHLLLKSTDTFKTQLESLLLGHTITYLIDEYIAFSELDTNEQAVWSLFLMAGYLTVDSLERTNDGPLCQLRIPNIEIQSLYRGIFVNWLSDGFGIPWYNTFLSHLLDGNMIEFENKLKLILERIVSVHDMSHDPEAFYHGLLVGLTASLGDRKGYEIKSNRESGYGRYDYMILSQLENKPTIIFEFKKVHLPKKKSAKEIKDILVKSANEALEQINSFGYLAEAKSRGITNILKIGLAFSGKRFVLVHAQEGVL